MNRQFKKTMEENGAKTEVCFRVVFADGSSWQNHERRPDATIIIRSARAAWRVAAFALLALLVGRLDRGVHRVIRPSLACSPASDSRVTPPPASRCTVW